MRKGIDDDHLTYLDAGRIAVEEGVTAVALHGRTAAQHYGGTADWDAIARLKEHVPEIPVLGNGDIWCGRRRAADGARDRLRRRGRRAAAAWAGRGCSATWSAAFDRARPERCDRADPAARSPRVMRRHAELLGEWIGDEARGRDRLPQARRLVPQGLHGRLRDAPRLAMTSSLAELDDSAGRARPGPAVARGRGRPAGPYVREQPGGPAGRLAEGSVRLRRSAWTRTAEAELDTSGRLRPDRAAVMNSPTHGGGVALR